MVLGRHKASDGTNAKPGKTGRRMRGASRELADIDPVVNDGSLASREPIPGDVILSNSFGYEDYGISPSHTLAPNPFAVGIPVHISAVTCVHDDRNSSQARGRDPIVENQRVVSVKHVGTIYPEPGGEFPDQAERKPCGLAKRMHGHMRGLRFRGQLAWVGDAIDRGRMAFGLLLARQVNGEPLHSSQIKAR